MRYKLKLDLDLDDTTEEVNTDRREFLRGAAAIGGLTIAPGVMLYQTAAAKPAGQA